MADSEAKREYSFKILIVGEPSCGKTAILQRYVKNAFLEDMKATVGVDFYVKELHLDDAVVRLQFWDIAGQERYGHMTPMFYREASGAFVVYDVNVDKTFDCTPDWKHDLDNNLGCSIPTVLLGNKCDKPHTPKSEEEIKNFCDTHGFTAFFETSAKTDHNLNEAVRVLVDQIIKSGALPEEMQESDIIDPGQSESPERQRGGCLCS